MGTQRQIIQIVALQPAGERKMVLNLREKGGKRHRVPAHHKLQEHLDEYIQAAGLAEEKDEPLFRTANRPKELTERKLNRRKAWKMVKRRARQAGISKDISPHSMRATGITAFCMVEATDEEAGKRAGKAATPIRPQFTGRDSAWIHVF